MDSSIEDVLHKKFKYIYIPGDISLPVQEFEFEGFEKTFKKQLRAKFATNKLLESEKRQLSQDLTQLPKNVGVSSDLIEKAVDLSENLQIVPLTLPTKSNNYEAINAYIDNVGRVKNLQENSRATRICSDSICGDCYISRTFDDENIFKRIDFTLVDYDKYIAQPFSSKGRWSQEQAFQSLQQPQEQNHVEPMKSPRCNQCHKKENLKACSRCHKIYYCNVDCQKQDFPYHKFACAK